MAQPESYAESPLFLYLNMSRRILKNAAELENANPEFAELLASAAEDELQKTHYTNTRINFRKALALLPGYTRALNGMGNFCFSHRRTGRRPSNITKPL